MRRKDRAITQDEAMKVLSKAEYGVLSLVSVIESDIEPYGVPLNFCLMDGALFFHCFIEGKKVDCLSRNNKVSFTIVGRTNILSREFATDYESVMVFGQASEVDDEEKRKPLEGLVQKYSSDYYEEGMNYINEHFDRVRVFKIEIERITGKARNEKSW